MTTRVFNLQRPPQLVLAERRGGPVDARHGRPRDLMIAVFVAFLLVPIAGAAERPGGWFTAGIGAVMVLSLALICGTRLPWGWLALGSATLGYLLPRGQWSAIGPGLFVITVLCGWLWSSSNPDSRNRERNRPRVGSRERAAQMMQGISGERQVGRVLAEQLPQEYALINGLALRRGAGDIDHLVVGPTGLFLLETKTMAGHIVCAPDGTWHRTRVGRSGTSYDAYIGNPSRQVQRNIFAMRQTLRRRLSASLSSQVWIEGLVVFAHPKTELEADHSPIAAVSLDQARQRICEHVPRRRLKPDEVEAIVAVLLEEVASDRKLVARYSAQAMVELAVLLPAVLTLAFTTLAVSRYVQTHTAVVAVAHEAARAGALSNTPGDAVARMQSRAAAVAVGLGLNPNLLVLDWDLAHFSDTPARVEAHVSYPVDLHDFPLVGVLEPIVTADHVEWLDPFRSGTPAT